MNRDGQTHTSSKNVFCVNGPLESYLTNEAPSVVLKLKPIVEADVYFI